ncbi:MAG: sigma-70 family RNA polymerase sigma factor [Planctomycetota bacterium]|nr:MAG: sigma-70 family RNA polymerase sigma factor [Planctomycetota bacterium]
MFPTTDVEGWTQGSGWEKFFRAYQAPLARYARQRFGVDQDVAEDLAQGFIARELERAATGGVPLFRLYDPARGRFRCLLATCFWRYARDLLSRNRRRTLASLDALGESPPSEDPLAGMISREYLQTLRSRVREAARDALERAVLDLKWPSDEGAFPLPNAEVARLLGTTRSAVRRRVERIGASFAAVLREYARASGLEVEEIDPVLGDLGVAFDRSLAEPS